MISVKLEDIVELIRNGANIKNDKEHSGIPITRIETIADGTVDLNRVGFADITEDKYKDYYIKKNDILMSHINSIKHLGKTAFCDNDLELIHGMNLLMIRPNNNICSKYLYYYFNSKTFRNKLINISKQSVNQSSFTVNDLKNMEIKICDYDKQLIIAKRLDKISDLIKLRKKEIENFDDLKESQFIAMFGDILSNNIKYNKYELSKVADICSSKRIYASEYVEKGVPFYRSKEIIELGHNKKPSVELFITEDKYEEVKEKYGVPKKGDILVTAVGTIGETWIVNSNTPFYYKDGNLLLVRLKKYMSEIFFKYSLDILIDDFKRKIVSGSSYSALTIEKFKTMKVVYPPIEEQNRFAKFVEKVNKQKLECEENLKKLEELQSALMQEYFG